MMWTGSFAAISDKIYFCLKLIFVFLYNNENNNEIFIALCLTLNAIRWGIKYKNSKNQTRDPQSREMGKSLLGPREE